VIGLTELAEAENLRHCAVATLDWNDEANLAKRREYHILAPFATN